MAENYIKKIHKIVQNGSIYLRMENRFYKLLDIEVKGSEAEVLCHGMDDDKDLHVKLVMEGGLLKDLVCFGLKDKKNSIFIIDKDTSKQIWFETSVESLTREIYTKELYKIMEHKLRSYKDIEEN